MPRKLNVARVGKSDVLEREYTARFGQLVVTPVWMPDTPKAGVTRAASRYDPDLTLPSKTGSGEVLRPSSAAPELGQRQS